MYSEQMPVVLRLCDGIIDDPDKELMKEPDDDEGRDELSTDPDDEWRDEPPSTDSDDERHEDAGVAKAVLRRLAEVSQLSDRPPVGCVVAATFALPAGDAWKELPNKRLVAFTEASTVFVKVGECSLEVSFILSATRSNPVLTGRTTGVIVTYVV